MRGWGLGVTNTQRASRSFRAIHPFGDRLENAYAGGWTALQQHSQPTCDRGVNECILISFAQSRSTTDLMLDHKQR